MKTTKRTALVRASENTWTTSDSTEATGATECLLIGAEHGSVHQEVSLVELAPGGVVPGHIHPFEESFFIMSGEAVFTIAERSYRLRAGDYGFAPLGVPHAWRNVSTEPCRRLRVRAPQPKQLGEARGVYPHPDLKPAADGSIVGENPILDRYVGHLEDDLPPYGPIATRGITAYGVKHISVRLLVEDTLGATHHVMFVAQLPPAPPSADKSSDAMEADPAAKAHFHQYEEVYHIVAGRGLAFLDGEKHIVGPGDTILAGVGGSHSVINAGDEPLRWIETQVPRPPERDGIFWERDWTR